MKIAAYEATVENGQIKLPEDVRLPDRTKVYVVVPDVAEPPTFRVGSPRLARPGQAGDFLKEVLEVVHNPGI